MQAGPALLTRFRLNPGHARSLFAGGVHLLHLNGERRVLKYACWLAFLAT